MSWNYVIFPLKGKKPIPIRYKEIIAGEHRLELLIDSKVVLELKAVEDFEDIHSATNLSYMRATKTQVGLLINFNKPRLVDGIKRFQL